MRASSSLSISLIRDLADSSCFEEIDINETSRVISFYNHDIQCRVNVYYTTGTVATCLTHPISGKTQLFRRNVTLEELSQIFLNPRTHTGRGYYRQGGATSSVAEPIVRIRNALDEMKALKANGILTAPP